MALFKERRDRGSKISKENNIGGKRRRWILQKNYGCKKFGLMEVKD